jgi:hypothetical protein
MSWFDDNCLTEASNQRSGTEIMEAVSLSPKRLGALADYLGVQITTDKEGNYISVPPNINLDDPKFQSNFIHYWMQEASLSSRTEHDRQRRIQTYKAMDELMAEASISLDTYSDEALGVGFIDDPVQIKISDQKVQSTVYTILGKSEIFKRYCSMIRNLIKYGDLGYKINFPAVLDKDPEDITLEYVDPLGWECTTSKESPAVIGYQIGERRRGYNRATSIPGNREGRLQLWEFIQMTVFDEDTKSYGRSLLEPMRVDFDHLCLSGDTKVFTLEGSVPIRDLVGKPEFWVMACDPSTMKMVPRKARQARITRKNAEFVKVNLRAHPKKDSHIIVTPDHRILMTDGTY